MLPPSLVMREGRTPTVEVHVRHGEPVSLWIDLETGGTRPELQQLDIWTEPRQLDDRLVGRASFQLPGDLPLGYHTLRAWSSGDEASMALIVTPAWVGLPDRMGDRRLWGIATQLYSVRSARSWGVGDVGDLEDLAVWGGAELGAGFVLVNPAARRRAGVPDGAVALPADDPPISEPAVPAGRAHPGVRRSRRRRPSLRGVPPRRRCTPNWTISTASTGTWPGTRNAVRSN